MFTVDQSRSDPEPTASLGTEVALRRLLAASRCLVEAVSSGQGERALLQLAIELAVDLVGARYGAIGVLSDSDEYLHFVHTGLTSEQAAQIGSAPKGHGVLRQILAQREVLRINNLASAPRGLGYPAHHPRMDTLLAAPILSRGRAYGRMYVCNRRDGYPFSADDELVIANLVQSLTLALDRRTPAPHDRAFEQELEQFKQLLDLAPGALLIVDEGIIVAANLHAISVLGARTLGQLMGRPLASLIHDGSRDALVRQLAEAPTTARLQPAELRVARLDETDGWVQLESTRIRYLGRPAALVSTKDITTAKATRQRLDTLHRLAEDLNRADSAEEVFRAGLEAMQAASDTPRAAIMLLDKNERMRCVACNALSEACRSAAEGCGPWLAAEADATPIFVSNVSDEDHPLEATSRALGPEGVSSYAVVPIVHRRHLIGKFMVCYDMRRDLPTDLSRHMLSIAEHVGVALSRQQAAERSRRLNHQLEARMRRRNRQLAEANRDLEAFSYSVSHDLRAPLRAMNGFATILLAEHDNALDDTGRGYLDRIVTASRRMEQLIDDLLRLSRVNRLLIQPQRVDISQLALEIAAKLQESEPRREVSWDIESDLSVDAEPGLVRILLENLIQNAWKYTSRKTSAWVRLRRTTLDGRQVFEISDNGAGFDPKYADKLFSPFQRLHTPAEFSGTGIGLAIVQRILRRHGGSIGGHGAPGEGATFWFSFWEDGNPDELTAGTGGGEP